MSIYCPPSIYCPLCGNHHAASQPCEVMLPTSDANDLDDVVRELGIEASDTTPAEAVRELKATIERLREPCPKWAANEMQNLRAQLAAAQTIATRERAEADVQIERRIEVEAELAARDARIAGLEAQLRHMHTFDGQHRARIAELEEDISEIAIEALRDHRELHARAERAEAELKAMREALKEIEKGYTNATQIARAALASSPAGPDGRNLAVIYCMERAEADVKLLREALEGMIAVVEGRFDGNPHADIDALAKARAARDHSLAGEKS